MWMNVRGYGVAYFKVLSQHLPGGNDKNLQKASPSGIQTTYLSNVRQMHYHCANFTGLDLARKEGSSNVLRHYYAICLKRQIKTMKTQGIESRFPS
jgi:hypothetical protein